MDQLIIIIAFFSIYFHISGLATTNILRLTRNNTLPILASKCVCDNCGNPISFFYQLPIISYILCRGKCKNCKVKIPVNALALELTVLIGMFIISAAANFSFLGITASFLYYEFIRILVIIKDGQRENGFVKQYIIAVIAMLPMYLITLFVALIYTAVCM